MNMKPDDLAALFELSRDAVIGITNNKICFANPAAQKLFSLCAGDTAGAYFPRELFTGGDSVTTSLKVNGRRAAVSVRQADGLWLLCLHPEEKPDANSEARSASRMVRGFSDSLMTLRMALDALVQRCRRVDDPRMADYAAVLYHEYFRMRRLCTHLNATANIARNELPCSLSLIDLEETVRELVDSVIKMSGGLTVDIQVQCQRGDYTTEADSSLIETMLLNFLSNSLQRCGEDGHILIGLRCVGDNFLLSVDDDGSGMTSETLAGALNGRAPFDPLDAQSGAGLGLMYARGIAERHGGTVLIESGEGKGCRVRVTLPQRKPTELVFRHPRIRYEVKDAYGILTELSAVLPTRAYKERFFD